MPLNTNGRTPLSYGLQPTGYRLPDTTHVGPVHLLVSDLARSLEYYERVLGLQSLAGEHDRAMLGSQDERPLVELQTRAGVASAGGERGTASRVGSGLEFSGRGGSGRPECSRGGSPHGSRCTRVCRGRSLAHQDPYSCRRITAGAFEGPDGRAAGRITLISPCGAFARSRPATSRCCRRWPCCTSDASRSWIRPGRTTHSSDTPSRVPFRAT